MRDERAERERQIDGTNGRFERNRGGRGMKEAAIYAPQKSPTKRARSLPRIRTAGEEELQGREIELTAYHGKSKINRKESTINASGFNTKQT